MKTLFRICLVGFVLVVVVLVVAFFVLTNAGFQKSMLEGKLPAGSSIKHVHVTTSSLKLSQLILVLPDGTRVKIEEVDTSFSPLAAIFDNTIEMGALHVDGLMVQLPESTVVSTTSTGEQSGSTMASSEDDSMATDMPDNKGEASNPWDSVNAIGELEWLVDIESIRLNGKIKDATGTTYEFDVASGAIRPSTETVVDASMTLVSSEPIQSGLKEFSSDTQIRFKQKAHGGFEQLSLKSNTAGKDVSGREIVAVNNELTLTFDGFDETASLVMSFDADLQRPELFMPELVNMGALELAGSLEAKVDGVVTTLSAANLAIAAKGVDVLVVDLKKALNLGGKQDLSGELLNLQIRQLPLAWLSPWMPEGMSIQGAPLDVGMSVHGLSDGAMEMTTTSAIRIGPISMQSEGQAYLQEATVVIDPVIRVNADQSVDYEIKTFQLIDRYGEVLSGQVNGRAEQVESSSNPLAGLQADLQLSIRLQELFQQPLLKDQASILGGALTLVVKVDGASAYPVVAQGDLKGLRPRSAPGSIKDYRFVSQLQVVGDDAWGLGLDFESGIVERPSTSLQVSGQANLAASPQSFILAVTGSKLSQSDIDVLVAAFSPNESTVTMQTSSPASNQSTSAEPPLPMMESAELPAWAGIDGKASIKLDQFVLKSGQIIQNIGANVIVSEPLLKVSELTARAGEGTLNGFVEVNYDPAQVNAYGLLADVGFQQFDPAFFSQKSSGSFPVTGLFDGDFKLSGAGSSLETAADNSVSDLTITGREGLLTAFELDNRSQLGLGLAGILGRQLDRPGIAALSETIPYFKDIPFDNFILELKRGEDRKVMIPKLRFEGQSLLIDGTGIIAASSFEDLMDQPLQLGLELGAKGRLTNYLETLQLLQPAVAEDGFRRWTHNVNIDGTLGKPNTDQIMDLLKAAAQNALVKTEKPVVPAQPVVANPGVDATAEAQLTAPPAEPKSAPVKKSKEEQLRDEIDIGLDLLNTVFGD